MMGATQYDVYTMAPELASTLCRFCMKPEHGEPHYNLDWYKWPNAEVTRLYEKVVGQQLPVSSHLSEQFCSACHWWLKEANEKIKLFQQVDSFWRAYVKIHELNESQTKNLKSEHIVEQVQQDSSCADEVPPMVDEVGYKVEYLDMDVFIEEDHGVDDPAADADAISNPSDLKYYDDDELLEVVTPISVNTVNKKNPQEISVDEDLLYVATKTAANTRKPQPSMNLNRQEISVECDLCGQICDSKELLLEHFTCQHSLRRHFSCELCSITFLSIEEQIHHHKIHPAHILECCNRVYNNKRQLRRHRSEIHQPFTPFICDVCNKVFPSKPKLTNHMQRHGEKQHVCDKCGRTFHLKKDLKYHQENIHQHLRRFPCDQCNRRYSTKFTLLSHQSRCGLMPHQKRVVRISPNTSIRPELWCDKCVFKCMRPDTLRKHYSKEHQGCDYEELEQCICIKCLRQFHSAELLAEHRFKHHPTFQCDICKAILASEVTLERHKKIHTATNRPFTCPVCLGTYVTQHQLKMHHRRKHTNERPFACPVCDKRYAERSEMNVHIRSTHNDGLRFPCTQCPKTYNTSKYLAMHVAREHTGDFNFFECPTCQYRFVNARVLSEHQAVNHPILDD